MESFSAQRTPRANLVVKEKQEPNQMEAESEILIACKSADKSAIELCEQVQS
jgi:hypothetical protein